MVTHNKGLVFERDKGFLIIDDLTTRKQFADRLERIARVMNKSKTNCTKLHTEAHRSE